MDRIACFASALRDSVVNVLGSSIPDFTVEPLESTRISGADVSLDESVFIIIGLTGQLKGRLIVHFDKPSAKALAGCMMMAGGPVELDRIALSALTELTNMVSGNALMSESMGDFNVDIAPPTLFFGQSVSISSIGDDCHSLPFRFPGGLLTILIALQQA